MANIDVDAAVEEATSKENFDVLAFVQGSNLPTHDVTVYTDGDAALRMARILIAEDEREQRRQLEGVSLADDDEAVDEDEITELHDRLVASLVFHMQGLAPSATRALHNKLKATHPYVDGGENPEYTEAFNNTLIAKSILSVENAAGAKNTDKWTAEKVSDLLDSLYVSEANKIFDGAAELTYIGAIFDRAVSADFS